tara:strand:- start:566 stop:985 length:420 start_codon:yes stop_codon:yes gene_type:complete
MSDLTINVHNIMTVVKDLEDRVRRLKYPRNLLGIINIWTNENPVPQETVPAGAYLYVHVYENSPAPSTCTFKYYQQSPQLYSQATVDAGLNYITLNNGIPDPDNIQYVKLLLSDYGIQGTQGILEWTGTPYFLKGWYGP